MKTVALPSGERVPAIGLGTWHMGDNRAARAEEIATLRLGFERGATLIDTAEMYGTGRAEELVGEAIAGRRDQVFLVSKVLPQHASRKGVVAACEASLRRLRTDRIDLYLLHWRGDVPLAETLNAFKSLQQAGKIRHFGVSNFDTADMRDLWSVPGGSEAVTDQLYYNLAHRGIEWDVLPWLRRHKLPVMAYAPLDEGRLAPHPELADFARQNGMTAAQAALAWLLSCDDVIVIPKTRRAEHLQENLAALERPLSPAELDELDRLFAPPRGSSPLEIV